jgi:chromosomal replication initiation ATPase DnaA
MENINQAATKLLSETKSAPTQEPRPNVSQPKSSPFAPFNASVHRQAAIALEAVKHWTRDAVSGNGRGLVLWASAEAKAPEGEKSNGYGNGKTLLAKCAANALYATLKDKNDLPDRTGIFTTSEAFMAAVKASFDNHDTLYLFRQYRSARFLIIDDFGTEYAKELAWLQEQFYKLLNHAYDAHQPFMLTSNMTPAAMLDRLGGKNWSRLRGMVGESGFINMSHIPDQRKGKQ